MLSSDVAQSLKSYGHFSDLRVGIALSNVVMDIFRTLGSGSLSVTLDFSGKANTFILGEDNTAI